METLEQVPEHTQWTRLKRKILAVEPDAKSFYLRKNRSAGRRLRKALQDIQKIAKLCRQESLEFEKEM